MRITSPSQIFFGHQANPPDRVSSFRRILPQCLAGIAQSLISANIGLAIAFSTIVVSAVTGNGNAINPNESLHITRDEASWLASISFIAKICGCCLSGLLCDWLGRKKSIVVTCVVPVIGWLLLATAHTQVHALAGFATLGFGIGLTITNTYLSEVAEASVRGVLMASGGFMTALAIFSVYLSGAFLPWRYVAFISTIVPFACIIFAIFLPETPIWLLSKARDNEAIKSLQWLRGWVSSEAVTAELGQLKMISELSIVSCAACERLGSKCEHSSSRMMDKFRDMTHKRTLKPFVLLSILFFFIQFSGMFATRPYIVSILDVHGMALDPNVTTIILGLIGTFANVVLSFSIRSFGKRKIYLYSMVGNFSACLGLAVYGYTFFPAGWTSLETGKTQIIKDIVRDWNYFALAMFLLMQFFLSYGVSSVPYILQSELFPFKSRSFYCSISSALNQLFGFFATKTFYDSEQLLSLPGVFAFYGMLGVLGYALMYFMLPETEHRSLEDIELHYSDNNKSIFDINIRINAAGQREPKATHDT